MKTHLNDGIIALSGQDLADLVPVVDEALVRDLGGIASRRVEAAQLKKRGQSWSQARKAALRAMPTPEMLAVIRACLARGGNNKAAILAVIEGDRP